MNKNTQFINKVNDRINSTNDIKKKNKLLEMIGCFYKDDFEKEYNKYKYSVKNKKLNEKYSPSLVNNLTDFGASKIISKCIEINTESSYKLLLSLFTGRNIQLLNSKKDFVFRHPKTKILFFKYTFSLKEINKNKKLEKKLGKNLKEIKLELPCIFEEFSSRDKSNPSSVEEAKEILEIINLENTLRINLNQVQQYLNYILVNKQIDSTIISIINGQFKSKVSGVYYSQIDINKIETAYSLFLKQLSNVGGFKYIYCKPMQIGTVGSNFVPKRSFLIQYFKLIHKTISLIKIQNAKDIEEQFNLFTIYTLQILNLSTGLRPVNDPYQTINSFNISLKTLMICDKRKNDSISERLIVLNEIAISQLLNYLSYLEDIISKYEYIFPEFIIEIKKILIGEQAIFGFLENGEFIRISKSVLVEKLNNILPLELNWHRHYMRTTLIKKNVQGNLIDMWMGHEGLGGYGLDEFSNCSIADLNSVAIEIKNILTELDIKPVSLK